MEAKKSCIHTPGLVPLLVFTLKNRKKTNTFFNVSEGSYKVRSIPEMHQTYFMASYHGWLVLRDCKDNIFLLNPVSRQKILLPYLTPNVHISCILLSSPPTDPDCMIILFSFPRQSCIYCHLRSKKWIEREYNIEEMEEGDSITNFVYCNHRVYAYTLQGVLGVVDIDAEPMITWLGGEGPKMPPAVQVASILLVESFGEMFLIQKSHDLFIPQLLKFEVYKMNFATTTWECVDTLGDRVLFLGADCSTSCSATAAGMKGNSIYFTEENDKSLYVYHLDRGTIYVDLPCPNVQPPWTHPFWLMPIAGDGYAFKQAKQGRLKVKLNNTEKEISSQTENKDMLELTEKEEVAEHVPWLDLPSDILEVIALHLFRVDFVHLTSVCRRWRSISPPSQIINWHLSLHPNDDLPLLKNHTPWLMFFRKDDGMCNFLDPVYNETYSINVPELLGSSLSFSKDGWVFMYRGYYSVFLFNPFIKAKIELPDLEFQNSFNCVSFSSTPAASECIIFAVENFSCAWLMFHICHRGDKSWTEHLYFNDVQFPLSCSNPVFYGEVFYILGHDGRLGVYDPKQDIWTILTKPKPLKFCNCETDARCKWKNYLVESRGKLFMVFVGFLGNPIHIFVLDFSKMEWVEVEALEDQMLFVGHRTSLSSAAVAKGMGNKIYFPMISAQQPVFYSLEDGKCHPNSDFYKSEEYIYSTWVEPRWSKLSAEELNWSKC